MQYSSVEDAAHIIANLGAGCFLAKIDIAHTYRNIPLHVSNHYLLGMEWEGGLQCICGYSPPFRVTICPKDLHGCLRLPGMDLPESRVSNSIHYLDDFSVLGKSKAECQLNLDIILQYCQTLGVPVKQEKVEGPTMRLTFLGIELDTETMTMCLPMDKYDNLQAMIAAWVRKQSVQKRELLSLIGHLAQACKVVPPGRTFLRRMIDLSTIPKHLDHWVRLNKNFHSDLLWWDMFLPLWNRHSLLSAHGHPPPEIMLATDASGLWGCGAVWPPHWFHLPWTSDWSGTNIAVKELVSITLAAAVGGGSIGTPESSCSLRQQHGRPSI